MREENEQYIRESYKSGATIVLKWINKFHDTNKEFPSADEIVAQLEMAIEEEVSKEIEAQE